MKKLKFLLLLFSFVFSSGYLTSDLSRDAIILTLRQQNSVRLDYELCNSIDSLLRSAILIDTNLNSVYALPQYSWNDLFIRPVRENIPWFDSLLNNGLISGDAYIDSLNNVFHLTKAENFFGTLLLRFDDTLRADLLAEVYQKHPDIWLAQPNYSYYFDNPNNIYFLPDCGENKFVFVKQEPSGPYWYIQVDSIKHQYYSKLIKTDTLRTTPKIFLWNVPDRYSCTNFKSVYEIKDSITKSQCWWVRRHAIESSKLLFKRKRPLGWRR